MVAATNPYAALPPLLCSSPFVFDLVKIGPKCPLPCSQMVRETLPPVPPISGDQAVVGQSINCPRMWLTTVGYRYAVLLYMGTVTIKDARVSGVWLRSNFARLLGKPGKSTGEAVVSRSCPVHSGYGARNYPFSHGVVYIARASSQVISRSGGQQDEYSNDLHSCTSKRRCHRKKAPFLQMRYSVPPGTIHTTGCNRKNVLATEGVFSFVPPLGRRLWTHSFTITGRVAGLISTTTSKELGYDSA